MRDAVVAQFRHPQGLLGRLAGWIMAYRDSNRRRNAWVVSLLEIEPQHHVLEIGCGPGIALGHALRQATEGRVVGIDHSALMVEVASKRNAEHVSSGRLEVLQGTADAVADLGERFDRVFAVNVAQFWDAPAETLGSVRRSMQPGGVIAIAHQPRNRGASDEDARRATERLEGWLGVAGFTDLRVEMLDLHPAVACVLGRARGDG